MAYEEGGWRRKAQIGYYALAEKVATPLVRIGVTPDVLTVAGVVFSIGAGILFALGEIFWGGIVLWLSGIMDPLDGTVARLTGKASRSGALFDSTMDRYAEFFIFFGFLVYFRSGWMFYVVMLALMGSLMVSYVKARGESLGQKEVRGLMQRPERLILLMIGTILNTPFNHFLFSDCDNCTVKGVLLILAVLTNVTAIERLVTGRRELSK
ncbi:MAG TPA: CDP-alcohol phosphatidyltransferase family protein [Syntrophales bacterium]|nr:CDP-alcohol phosphatidyltransferase family protein [Syntrophales bacterium]HOX94931.1 CDP-alcohol phosphatidyltransferase family protein [Syntrophales bacterium]HPI58327.1 CDP-alcohol phosphatidyltransferase family protein [Syntrophales bacterium]HPN26145.1 CDP-alcohol phosphatidyltransferase family protein [Syntrophales bacterium]HQM30522.1 CDP-alcohol phosphatidyltransferase family protein [Syntrophales bacterium]